MIKIGDFARLSHVSVVTLRHYDEIGLLPPAAVDRHTGYRSYVAAQLPRLHRILALKDLGFSLEQIARVLCEGLTPEQLRGMLRLKQAEVEQHVAAEQARVARIAVLVRQIEQEETMPAYAVALKIVPALLVAARRVTIPRNEEVLAYLGAAFAEVEDHARSRGRRRWGPAWPCGISLPPCGPTKRPRRPCPSITRSRARTGCASTRYLRCRSPPPSIRARSPISRPCMPPCSPGSTPTATGSVGSYREVYVQHERSNRSASATEIHYPVDGAVEQMACRSTNGVARGGTGDETQTAQRMDTTSRKETQP